MNDRVKGNWSDETEAALREHVGSVEDAGTVSQETVVEISDALNRTTRSVAAKLRNMGYTVESVSAARTPVFSSEATEALRDFVVSNSGNLTYAQIAAEFEGGAYNARQVQGKILSLELTEHVAPTPPKESTRTYTDEQEEVIVRMVGEGASLEAITEAVGREMNSVRGKCLSLYKQNRVSVMPKQENTKGSETTDYFDGVDNVGEMTVAEIAEALGKTPRGVKIALTRRGLSASDYTPKQNDEG